MSQSFDDDPLAVSQTSGRVVSAVNIGAKSPDREEMPYNPNGRADYPLSLWSLGNLKERRLLHGHTTPIMCVDMTRDGKQALTGSTGRLLRLWDLDEGVCLQILPGHRGIVFDCALSEDARFAVSGSEDMTVRLWDLVQGRLLFTFTASSAVTSCDISRDGSVAIAAESSGRIHTFALVEQSV
jgi:WD40 repeat protein